MHPARKQKRKDYMSMNPNQLRRKIFQMQTFIEGQFSGGSYDSQDMYDTDFGHLSTLVDMIDAHNANSPDNKMDYPKIRDETMRPVQYGSYQVVQEKIMKITKRQLRNIIREALGDRGDLPQKHQYKIGMTEAGLPPGKVTSKIPNAKYDPELPPATSEKQWVDWAEGYGMFPEYDNDGQMLFYYTMDDDVDGTITNEAEFLGGAIEPAPYPSQTTMIYTGVYR